MHIRPVASDLGRPQCHIQAQGIARLPGEPSTSKAGQKPASITESLSKSYIWILSPGWFTLGEEGGRGVLTSALETQLQGTCYQSTRGWVYSS